MNERHMDALLVSGGYGGERKPVIPMHIILADRIRSMIKSGSLKPGHRFLPTKELASELKTYPLAVHEAFKILSADGLIERRSRTGTFVSSNSAVLGSVAIYLGVDIMGVKYLEFPRLVYEELAKQLKKEGVSYTPLLDPRSDEKQDEPWDTLVKALEKRKYQGVIALSADALRMKWLKKLGVPLASPSDTRMKFDEFAEKSAGALREQNCRSAGLIATFPKNCAEVKQIKDAIRRNGMEFRDEWHVYPEGEFERGTYTERFGHDGFMRIWSQEERPDGLIVFPDTALPSVSLALVRQKVSVPDDLKLAVHMNKGSEISFPFDATMILFDPAEAAAAILRQLKRKLAGEAPTPEEIGYSVR